MIVEKVFKFGNIIMLTLNKDIPNEFTNHSNIIIDGRTFKDVIIPSPNGDYSRRDVSVIFDGDNYLVGKEVLI
ncbi:MULTISPECIES: hypothetical protein [unclassified Gemella]|uniref:hypothetical protein n=1 Tax=unclassified Gemella TaxID=2624949 RepID=UPI00107312A6|nr:MULTISPECIES: hypothetical protein [unclassified Gemella]MBF0709673.1 hypothetical protein [Gemella sp. GL1.1]MBF0746908.1 hypothetical protein [Gemella sp. 19428wG2_WT2a]NYS27017.1 hypothetical protein [Gemella sp. GL1]TFU59134.1 hypothetical protein E4T67_04495 [Gemella sp. WT2a]